MARRQSADNQSRTEGDAMRKFTDVLATITLVVVPFTLIVLVWIVIAMELLQFHYPNPW